jgi:hypothetical protein
MNVEENNARWKHPHIDGEPGCKLAEILND